MENEKVGRFIAEMRKSKKLTQKALADRLYITDKAVSKWERGISCPDISLLNELARILGVTTYELLNGEKNADESACENVSRTVENVLDYADKSTADRMKKIRNISALSFTAFLIIGIVTCAICDLAITKSFTWSLYPIISSVFVWLVFFSVIMYGSKAIVTTLSFLSVTIIPYIYSLSRLTGVKLVMTIGSGMSVISVIFIWSVFILFRIFRTRKLLAAAISALLTTPVVFLINLTLSKIISEPIVDAWDILTFFLIIICASVLFYFDSRSRRVRSDR